MKNSKPGEKEEQERAIKQQEEELRAKQEALAQQERLIQQKKEQFEREEKARYYVCQEDSQETCVAIRSE